MKLKNIIYGMMCVAQIRWNIMSTIIMMRIL